MLLLLLVIPVFLSLLPTPASITTYPPLHVRITDMMSVTCITNATFITHITHFSSRHVGGKLLALGLPLEVIASRLTNRKKLRLGTHLVEAANSDKGAS